MFKKYVYMLIFDLVLAAQTPMRASEPVQEQKESYVVVETEKKAPPTQAFMLEFPSEQVWKTCIKKLEKIDKKLHEKTRALLAPLFFALTKKNLTHQEKIATLDSLQRDIKLLLQRARPFAYAELKITYESLLKKAGISTHEVYPLLDIKNSEGITISLEKIQKALDQKKAFIATEKGKLPFMERELLAHEVAQAQQDSPIATKEISNKNKKKREEDKEKIRILQKQISIEKKRREDLEKMDFQLDEITPLFRSIIWKTTFDAYLGGEEEIEKFNEHGEDETQLQALLASIEQCKKELEPKKTSVHLPTK